MKPIAVIIADDHPLVRKALKTAFRKERRIEFVAEAGNGIELLDLIETHRPDIAVIDLEMPEMKGYEVLTTLNTRYPEVKPIVFSGFLNDTNQQKAIRMGAYATISKADSSQDILAAFWAVINGNQYHTDVSDNFYADPVEQAPGPVLTLREKQILKLIGEGKTSKQISELFNISKWTVDKHRSNIKEKLGLKNMAQIIRYAIESEACRNME